MADTTRWVCPYLEEGQQNPEADHNEALDILTAVLGLYIINRTTTTPPAVVDGACYLVPFGAAAPWNTHIGELAVGRNGAWAFIVPENGIPFYIEAEGCGGFYINGFSIRNPSPRFVARRDSVLALSGETDLAWDVELQKDAYFTHSASSANIAAGKSGIHECVANVTLERTSGTGNTVFVVRLYVNGTLAAGAVAYGTCSADQTPTTVTLARGFDVGVDGYNIKLTVQVVSGSAVLRVASIGNSIMLRRP